MLCRGVTILFYRQIILFIVCIVGGVDKTMTTTKQDSKCSHNDGTMVAKTQTLETILLLTKHHFVVSTRVCAYICVVCVWLLYLCTCMGTCVYVCAGKFTLKTGYS